MSRGVESNVCVISLNRFENTSRGGESGSIRFQWLVRTELIPLAQCGQAFSRERITSFSLEHSLVFTIFIG